MRSPRPTSVSPARQHQSFLWRPHGSHPYFSTHSTDPSLKRREGRGDRAWLAALWDFRWLIVGTFVLFSGSSHGWLGLLRVCMCVNVHLEAEGGARRNVPRCSHLFFFLRAIHHHHPFPFFKGKAQRHTPNQGCYLAFLPWGALPILVRVSFYG